MTRLRLDMMISRHPLTAIAIPSLRSLQIRVVPPKQTPQIEGFVFTDITRIPPVTRLRLDMMDISTFPNGDRYSVLASLVLTNPVTSTGQGLRPWRRQTNEAIPPRFLFIRLAVVNTFFKQGGIADGKDNFG